MRAKTIDDQLRDAYEAASSLVVSLTYALDVAKARYTPTDLVVKTLGKRIVNAVETQNDIVALRRIIESAK